jgi:hypothetical protein
MTACRPELWHDLFVAGAAAALTGLIFGAFSWPADFFFAGRLFFPVARLAG